MRIIVSQQNEKLEVGTIIHFFRIQKKRENGMQMLSQNSRAFRKFALGCLYFLS